MEREFKVFYKHPSGGYRYITTVKLTADYPLSIERELEEVFNAMQGENWSPNGEARGTIETLGVRHTSLYTGDLVMDKSTQKAWICDALGWSEFKGCALDKK